MDANYQHNVSGSIPPAGEFSETLRKIFQSLQEYSQQRAKTASLELSPISSHHVHPPLIDKSSPHLYDGVCGVAFFCAAYYSITREPQARELALRLVQPLRAKLQRLAAAGSALADQPLAIGGMVGLGSFFYSFRLMADWLKAPELMDAARDVTTLITPQRIMNDDRLDVVAGCAGTLLALLSFMHEKSLQGDDAQLRVDLALLCGQRLLDSRVPYKSGPRAWPVSGRGLPIGGFAYGAAGISCSLARLFQHTGQEQFLEAAIEGFAFERSLFVTEEGAWIDPQTNNFTDRGSWCYGAPGVALSRLGSLAAIDLPVLHQDLEESLTITRALPESGYDHICCGNFGRIDVLHTAGTQLERLQLSDYALALSRRILARATNTGFYFDVSGHQKIDGSNDIEAHDGRHTTANLTLFRSLAGIGYVLLRLSYPDLFPSVLLLESLI
jgi:lantibiotic modifying enzyme